MNCHIKLKDSFISIAFMFFGLAILIPVSNVRNTLNNTMSVFAYIFLLIVLFAFIILLNKFVYNRSDMFLNLFLVFLPTFFTILTYIIYPGLDLKTGDIMKFLILFLFINIPKFSIKQNRFFDIFYLIVSIVIIGVGFISVMKVDWMNEILRTYYVNHYPHVYTAMIQANKPVTFFATHSIAVFCYYLFFMGWEFSNVRQHKWVRYTCQFGFFSLIVVCRSMSSVLCVGLILMYYIYKFRGRISKKNIMFIMLFIILACIVGIGNFGTIIDILTSKENGILGRYFGGKSALSQSIDYIMTFGTPSGFYNIPDLFYADSGYVVYILRGSLLFVILIACALYRVLKRLVENPILRIMLFIGILLFEVGYPVMISQRFVATLLFVLLFVRQRESNKQCVSSLSTN